MPEEEKNFLFVCGCPRSGTTALWQVLMGSSDIFLGIERFGSYMARRNIGKLTANHYTKDRFFTMQDGDTHYNDLAQFHEFSPYAPTAERDHDAARFIGDKIPRLYNDFHQFGARFPGARVIFIIRNVFDVCLSYQRRLENESDAWRLGYDKAVEDWNLSIQRFTQAQGTEFSGLVVEYENLFDIDDQATRERTITEIEKFTGVADGQNLMLTHQQLSERSLQLEQKRAGDKLSAQAKRHILLKADIAGYRSLIT